MAQFTCISCRVSFIDADVQRQHYKTDWHRYNLKRKVVGLLPVRAEEFQTRVLLQRSREDEEAKDKSTFCKICRKSFASTNAFDNHLNSKKHKEGLSSYKDSNDEEEVPLELICEPVHRQSRRSMNEEAGDDSDIEEVDSDEWDGDVEETIENNPILRNNCLFCNHHSRTMTKNLNHMSVDHSFFIPDVEYLTDIRGLLLYLGEKICKFYMCLWCNLSGKGFHSAEAAMTHMRDKGHCKLLHEGHTLFEYERFYNYASSYPEQEEKMDVDEEVDLPTLDGSEYQLTLPSGATVGHRALLQYYKQYFGPNQAPSIKKNKLNKVIAGYRALGWTASDKMAIIKKARDIKYMHHVQDKYFMQLGVKANKLQKHFRPQVNF